MAAWPRSVNTASRKSGANHRPVTAVAIVGPVSTRSPPASHAYSWGLLLAAACAVAALAAGGGLTAGPSLWRGWSAWRRSTLLPWAVRGGDRRAVTLNHLPILAAVSCARRWSRPLLGGAAGGDRQPGLRPVRGAVANAGGVALAAAAAVGAVERRRGRSACRPTRRTGLVLRARPPPPRPSSLVNHLLVSGMIALKYGEAAAGASGGGACGRWWAPT